MATIFSKVEKIGNKLAKEPLDIWCHTNKLKRKGLIYFCKVEKIADNGEEVSKHLSYGRRAKAYATYRISRFGEVYIFTVPYMLRGF